MSDDLLAVLILDDPANHAEAIINQLRNQGLAIEAESLESLSELEQQLQDRHWDLLLLAPRHGAANPIDIFRAVLELQPELGVVIVANLQESGCNVHSMLAAGARDLIDTPRQDGSARAIIQRETEVTRLRHQLVWHQKALAESNHRAQVLVKRSKEAIAYIQEGIHLYANDSYRELFGYEQSDDLIGLPFMDLLRESDQKRFKLYLRQFMAQRESAHPFEGGGVHCNGAEFELELVLSYITYEGDESLQVVIYNREDSTELARRLAEAKQLDPLTGAYHQQHFIELFRQQLQISGQRGLIMLLTPDNSRELRSRHGFSAAEQFVVGLYRFIQHELQQEQLTEIPIGRFGSSSFLLLFNQIPSSRCESLATAMVTIAKDQIFDLEGKSIHTTLSIALIPFQAQKSNYQELLNEAERLIQTLQQAGGSRSQLYAPTVAELTQSEQIHLLAIQIQRAIQENQLLLLYQPIASLSNDDPHSTYEVLLRMPDSRHPDRYIPLEQFFEAVRYRHLYEAVDRWVIANSLKALVAQRRVQHYPRLFIKLSEASLLNQNELLKWMVMAFKNAQLKPWELVFEISERVATDQLRAAKQFKETLEKLKIRLAINQFGETLENLAILPHYESCYIKVAQSLINRLTQEESARQQLGQIVAKAQEHHIQVVANAVENPQTLPLLYSYGINYIVGFFIQKPSMQMNYDFTSFREG